MAKKSTRKSLKKRNTIQRSKRTKKVRKHRRRVQGQNKNPKRSTKKTQGGRRTPKRYYTVSEDVQLLNSLSQKGTMASKAYDQANKLKRKSESVRDRMKRYLKNISSSDRKLLKQHAKQKPNDYAYFKNTDNGKKIIKFSNLQPSLNNQTLKRRPRKSKKVIIKKQIKPDSFNWLKKKIYNKDPYFALEHQAQFLTDLFNHLILHHKIPESDIIEFLENTNTECSLEQILQYFKLKL